MSTRFKSRIPWREKLHKEQEPRLVDTPPSMQKQWGTGRMLIATPLLVDEKVRQVPKGKLVTVNQIMAALARDHSADSCCPMTTGLFLRIAAEAAEEDRRAGKKRLTPYWRVLKSDGKLNDKFPGGAQAQAERLRAEGHVVEVSRGGKTLRVKHFEKRLAEL